MKPRHAASLLVLLTCACSDEVVAPQTPPPDPDPLPETCDPVDLDANRDFEPCSLGSGSFGRWFLDGAGLPAYEYTLAQEQDARALWFNTEHAEWRHHWAAFGNHRINVTASNDGLIEVTTQDRGVEHLNKVDESQGWFGGGFSYIDDGEEVWATAYRHRPEDAVTKRVFGMGYARAETTHRGVHVDRVTFAPWGEATYLIDEVRITNLSSQDKALSHVEVFDVARRPIEINWLVSGDPVSAAPGTARDLRDAQNARFDEAVHYDPDARALVLRRSHATDAPPLPREAPSPRDDYPPDPFLAALVGDVSDTFTKTSVFLGDGGLAQPAALVDHVPGESIAAGQRGEVLSGFGQPRMFGLRSEVSVASGETVTLRFAYGYAPMGAPIAIAAEHRNPAHDALAVYRRELRERLVYFAADEHPALHRELAWHAYQVEASVGHREYFEGPVVPQGSAYLYLHGADGAARDLGIFAVPLTYFDPDLARAELELYMRVQWADEERFSYAFQGHGMLDDAMGIHAAPSDLDLFFLWALSEYVGATGDELFLERRVPFYPKEARPDATVRDHAVAALRHLFDVVGTGEHGLIGVGTGDWSDGIVVESPNRELAIAAGESVPNTQMAVAILPRVAALLDASDPALAEEIRARVEAYRAALPSAWGGSHFGRAYYGDGILIRKDRVDLEAQVWALIGDSFASDAERQSTIEAIRVELDEPSPAGATLQPGGQVWPAISGLLSEGYAVTRPDLAWSHFTRNTLYAHALAYPDVWYGIWSGPDGMNGPAGDRPGETWFSLPTPMTDYPVQNNNQHTMPILAAVRMAGVTATASGLKVSPKVPSGDFSLSTRLVDVHRRDGSLEVRYAPPGQRLRRVELVAKEGETVRGATVDGAPVDFDEGATSVIFEVLPADGASFELAIETAP